MLIPIGLIEFLTAHQTIPLKINFKSYMKFLIELLLFLRSRKKIWLAPLIFLLVIIGGLLIAAQGSVVAPFIYTLF